VPSPELSIVVYPGKPFYTRGENPAPFLIEKILANKI
jgi:hypothetical protein